MYAGWRLLLLLLCVQSLAAATEDLALPRGRRTKAIVPLLLGVVLKVSTLVPMTLMFMAFVVITALFTAKIALALVSVVGIHSHWHHINSGTHSINALAARVLDSMPHAIKRIHVRG